MNAYFDEVIEDITRLGRKVSSDKYQNQGEFPVIDQGQQFIAGYLNESQGLLKDIPAIVFGDHTRVLKYVDFPFFLGADGVKVLKVKNNNFLTKYVYYNLCASTIPNTGYNRHFKWLKQAKVKSCSLGEQQEVINSLDKVTDLIAKRKQQLEKLDLLVKSKFSEMFNKETKEDALINLCRFIDYRGKTPEKTESGLPFITAKNVKMHYMSFDTQEFISKDTYEKVMTRGFPKEGDVLFTTEAPLGNVCRIPHLETEFYIGQRIITMQTSTLEPAYLEYALSSESFRKKIAQNSSGSTVTGIRSKLLEQLTIPVPAVEMQKRFALLVEQNEKTKVTINQSLEKLEILKKALLQKYFG